MSLLNQQKIFDLIQTKKQSQQVGLTTDCFKVSILLKPFETRINDIITQNYSFPTKYSTSNRLSPGTNIYSKFQWINLLLLKTLLK